MVDSVNILIHYSSLHFSFIFSERQSLYRNYWKIPHISKTNANYDVMRSFNSLKTPKGVIRSAVNQRQTDNTMTDEKGQKDYDSWRNTKNKTTESLISNN